MAPDDAGFNSLTKDRKKECVYPDDISMFFQSLSHLCNENRRRLLSCCHGVK